MGQEIHYHTGVHIKYFIVKHLYAAITEMEQQCKPLPSTLCNFKKMQRKQPTHFERQNKHTRKHLKEQIETHPCRVVS